MKEILTQMSMECEGEEFFQYKFSDFVSCVSTDDLEGIDSVLEKATYFLQESKKISALEKKRRNYIRELDAKIKTRETREHRKSLTHTISLKQRKPIAPYKIPVKSLEEKNSKVKRITSTKI